ncbi:MAG: gliding motility-associated C-terminal domain-containing protein [Ferruginibacter sp.]
MAPGRKASDPVWGGIGMNESWRFIPSQGPTLYRKVELLDATGAVVAIGDTTRLNVNTFEASFPNICPAAGASLYVIKTTYQKIDDPTPGATIFSLDTINLIKQAALPVSKVETPTACGLATGTIAATASGGSGPYTFTITGPGGPYAPFISPTNTHTFTGLGVGSYTITVTEAGGCIGPATATIVNIPNLTATFVPTGSSCPGVDNGSLVITPDLGASAGPYTFTLTGPGGPYVQTNVISTATFTSLAGGTYSVTFANAGGCSGTTSGMVVAQGTGINSTSTTTSPTCPGALNGSLTVTATSGVGPYTYVLGTGTPQPTGVYTGLTNGTYTVTITDLSNGCTGIKTITISATGAGITSTVAVTQTSCAGVNDGTITITPTSGNGPYTFVLDGVTTQSGATATTFLNVSALPNHSIVITDANGCTGTRTVGVSAGTSLSVTATPGITSCLGASDGTITVNPLTPGVYTYTLNPGAISQPNPVFTGVAAGTYTVIITAPSGCTGTASNIIVGPGAALLVTATPAPTSCLGASDGVITVNPATPGVYTYTLNPGAISQPNPVFTGVAAGTYSVTITANSGCAGTVSNIIVSPGSSLIVSGSSSPTSCAGVNDGTINVNPVVPGNYTYTLNPGAIVQVNNPLFIGVAAGNYSVTILSPSGCSGIANNIIVGTGAGLTVSGTPTPTSCSGVNDGSITVNPGTPGTYSYTLNPGAVTQPNPLFTALAPGTYSVTITTPTGCIGTANNIIVGAGSILTGTTGPVTATSCPTVNDGTITVIPGGTGPYIFTLNPGNIVQNNNPVFINLSPGTYTITFTTASGCNGTVTVDPIIAQGPFLTSSTILDQPDCANIVDGSITIVPGPEAATPYASFTLTGAAGSVTQTSPIFINLSAGNYSYDFVDANGCTGTGNAVLITNSPLATTIVLTEPLCNGNANGVIVVNASGGVGPYQYALSPFSTYQATGTFNNLITGTYTFRIKDNVGCTKDTTVTLLEPSLLTAAAVNTTPSTCSGNDGVITVTGSGGTPPYQYSIDNGTTYQPTGIITAPAVGAYPNVLVRDSKGCIANASTSVALVDAMTLSIGNDTTICAESSVTFQPITNAATSVFLWRPLDSTVTPVSTINNVNIANAIATPLDTASYILHASWGTCSREDTIIINVLRKPLPNAGLDTAICNETFAILRGSATNLSGSVNFAWSPSSSVDDDSVAVTIAHPGTGAAVQIYVLTVTDNYGCNFSVTDDVAITVQPPVPAFAGNDTTAILGVPHQLHASGGSSYLWSPAFPLNSSTVQDPLATLTNDQLFAVIITDVAGCIGYDTIFVKVYEGPNYYVPNAFSPNGDGLNDVFRAIPVGIAKTDWFRVFNRYGQLMFETSQWLKGWDGRYKGKLQPIGAYVWIVKGKDKKGHVVEDKGTVMLVK